MADLSVTKTVSDATPNVGDQITFTVTLTNPGPDATGVQVTDLLPAGLSFVSANPSQGSYNSSSGLWDVGALASGAQTVLTIRAMVVSAAARTNTATITDADQVDPNTGNNTASATETPQQADLSVTKTVSNPTPNVGDQITFTVTLSNQGLDTATGVQVTDLLPAGVSFVSATPSQGSYNSSSGVWTVGTVSSSVPQTLSINAMVVSAAAQTNTAAITDVDQFDPSAANNAASATETPQQADLSVTKTVSNPTPNVGDQITFTITLTNAGPDAATGVQVTDLLPAGVSFVSATPSQGSYNSSSGVWTVGAVSSSVPQTLSINAMVVSAAARTNTAAITDVDQFDPSAANNAASATETPQQADVSVTKTVSNPTPNVGDQITFTITLTNAGPDAATGVQVTDLLPAGVSFVSATPSQGSYVSSSGVWTVGTVSSSVPQTLSINAMVVSAAARTNTAAITDADQFDPNTTNNSASATETPQQADLSVTKTVSDATPNVGDQITFTVTLSNQGPNAATGVQVTDLLPTGVSFVSATPSQGSYVSSSGVWTVGTVSSSVPQTLSITGMVVSAAARTNTAIISDADQFDPNTGNNTASATETPQQADLSVTKTVSDATPNVGDQITFTVTLANQGPNAATGVQVTDLLPTGVSFVSATPSQGSYVSSSGVWTVGTVSSSVPQTLSITGMVVSAAARTNTAIISDADQFDPNTGNNTASATETPQQADLVVAKTVSNPTPNVGDQIVYTITLQNAGPDAATGVQVTDPLPAGVSFVSATPSQGSYNSGTGLWDVGPVSSSVPQTLAITVTVDSATFGTNTATITDADQFDPNTANNTDAADMDPQAADLLLIKTVSDATPNVGDQITFSVTLVNNGPHAATGVQVTDLLPAGVTFVTASPGQGTYNSATGLWDVGTLANGAQTVLTIGATVVSAVARTNTGTITDADQVDPNTANNTASATETPQQADLALIKTVSDATPNVGDQITFTVTLSNQGPGAATGVQVTDLLPAGVSFVSATPSQGSYVSSSGVWTVGTVSSSAPQTLIINAMVVSAAARTNTATISDADQFDPNTTNNSASATGTPQQADLSVTKTVSNPTPNVGDQITFTVTLSNQGPDAATGVQVTDLLPAGVSFVSANPSQGSYVSSSGVWTVGTVSSGVPQTLIIAGTVVSPAARTNTATITDADQFDPNTANNTASATETPQHADVSLIKFVNGQDADSAPGPHVAVGSTVTFTYVVTNTGSFPLAHVVVTDDKLGTIASFIGDTNGNGLLDLSETWTYTATATALAGQQANTGTVTAQDASTSTTVTDDNPANYFGQQQATDFNADGKADLFWQTDGGALAIWQMNGFQISAADFTRLGASAVGLPGPDWHVIDNSDVSGDGKTDILWRTDGGKLAVWQMDGSHIIGADFLRIGATAINAPGLDWHPLGSADFDGDGKGDLLWRTDGGQLAIWELNGSQIQGADFIKAGNTNVGVPAPDWRIVGTGDFGGDGKADILWETTGGALALWQMDGTHIQSASFLKLGATNVGIPGFDWHVSDVADFDGDGKADILWRVGASENVISALTGLPPGGGQVAIWEMNGDQIKFADYTKAGATNVGAPGLDWHLLGADDMNGDGKADLLWQTDAGKLAVWQMDGTHVAAADYTKIGATDIGVPAPDWHVYEHKWDIV